MATTPRPPRAARGAPAPTPAPTAAPQAAEKIDVTEVLPKAAPVAPAAANLPAKLTRFAVAMDAIRSKMTVIEQFGADVRDLIANNPKDKKYDLTTKEGMKACDSVRKVAREKRLAIQTAWAEGKTVIKGLGDDLKAAAEADIGTLDAIETNAKTQIAAHEQLEEDRKKKHRDSIAAITMMSEGASTLSADDLRNRIEAHGKIIVDESYEEFQPQARTAHDDVMAVLNEALEAAILREEKAKKTAQAQAAIDAMKALPDQVEGTDLDNVKEVLRIHKKAAPLAADFGDMLETAELWHFKVTKQLEEIADTLEAAAAPAPAPTPAPTPAPLNATPAAGGKPVDDAAERSLSVFDDDPFPAAPAPTPAPVRSGGWSGRSPIPAPRPTSPPAPITDAVDKAPVDEDIPDLLKASKDFIRLVEETGGFTTGAFFTPAVDAAYKTLKAAVDFTSEFAE